MISMTKNKSFLRKWWVLILVGALFLSVFAGVGLWYAGENGVIEFARDSTSLTDEQLREVPLEELETMHDNATALLLLGGYANTAIAYHEIARLDAAMKDAQGSQS